jgi:hypothetical protein
MSSSTPPGGSFSQQVAHRLGFFSRGWESQEPNQLAAHATEGVMTNLAAGRTRQVAKYAMHDTQRAMPFGQNFSPELLGFRLIAK